MTRFSYSREAFGRAANSNQVAPLVALYCELIELELALKAYSGRYFSYGHHVSMMLTNIQTRREVREARSQRRTPVGDLGQPLKNRLKALHYLDKIGQIQTDCDEAYPNMRYLRHESDLAPSDGETEQVSRDHHITAALQAVKDIKDILKAAGFSWSQS